MAENSEEQRVCIKFCVANEIPCAESLRMLRKFYGTSTIAQRTVYKWYKAFEEGRKVVKNLPRGKPPVADENIDKVKKMLIENSYLTLKSMTSDLNMSYAAVCTILYKVLGMGRVTARYVPKKLNFIQKEHRKQFAQDILNRVNSDTTFMKRIITGDDALVYDFGVDTRQQGSQFQFDNEPVPEPEISRQSRTKISVIVFFDYRGIVYSEFPPVGRTIDKQYYLGVMKRLRENVRKKRPDLWKENSWILHHDYTPSHTSISVREFLTGNSTNVIDQAPYSPDMFPGNFFLLPQLKILRGKCRLVSIKAVEQKLQKKLDAITESAYNMCFDDWIIRLQMCVASNGDYIE